MEATRGHYDAANIHAMSGTQLAQRLINMGGGDSLEAHHVSFFARVNDQMTVFRQQHRSGGHGSPLTEDMAKVRFDSPTDAKQHLGAVVEISAMAVEQALAIPNPTEALRARRREDHAYYSSCFIAWHLAFKATIADKALSTTPEEALKWKALEQQYNDEKASAEKVFQMDLSA
jgi:tRNA U34 5-methylaminomethyl-2-thiouridine-forming methyltransferase MnmC